MKRNLLIVIVLLIVTVYAASAGSGPQDLYPTYRLMNDEVEVGVVYGLDYGWLVITDNDTIYTCGCDEDCVFVEEAEISTKEPTLPPPPTEEPTPEPTEKPNCNKGRGNGSEGCDPGNNPDKGNDDE